MDSLYQSIEGKEAILRMYTNKLDELDLSFHDITVQTSFGETHIIKTGISNAQPIIIVHGSNACAPIALETYRGLESKFQIYAVDIPAQPNKSVENRLSMTDLSYGKWMNEILDALKLNKVYLAGFSFGGLVILKTLEFDESRIKEVFLTAPAYITNGNPLLLLIKMFVPMWLFKTFKRDRFIDQFLNRLFTKPDQFAKAFLSKVFVHFKMDFTPVPVIDIQSAQKISTPITLFTAKQDLVFPGQKVIKRAKKIFGSLKKSILLEHSKHVQSKEDNNHIVQYIIKDIEH